MCFCWDLDVSVEVWGWQAYLKSWAQNCTQWKGLRTLLFFFFVSVFVLAFVFVFCHCVFLMCQWSGEAPAGRPGVRAGPRIACSDVPAASPGQWPGNLLCHQLDNIKCMSWHLLQHPGGQKWHFEGRGGKGDERQVDGKEDDVKMTTVCRSLTPVGEKKG